MHYNFRPILLFTPLPSREGPGEGSPPEGSSGEGSYSYHHLASPDRYPLLKEFAHENKRHATEAESVMWQALRSKRLEGYRFMRQYIIGDYIADFVNLYMKLVIEVDGGYHMERTQQEDDAIRTQWLEEHGFRVIRFTNEEVLFDLDHTLDVILEHLNS